MQYFNTFISSTAMHINCKPSGTHVNAVIKRSMRAKIYVAIKKLLTKSDHRTKVLFLRLSMLVFILCAFFSSSFAQGLHVDDGFNVLFGKDEISSGDKFLWDDSNNSLRFGYIRSSHSIGSYSTAWGSDNQASGGFSTAWGYNNVASGTDATAFGSDNISYAIPKIKTPQVNSIQS